MSFTVKDARGIRGRISIAPPGMHNVYNALAAVCVGLELEMPFAGIQAGAAELCRGAAKDAAERGNRWNYHR